MLLGPADAGPAVRGQVPVPGQPLLDAPRARGPARPAPAARRTRRSGGPRARPGPRRGTPRPARSGSGPCAGTLPSKCLVVPRQLDGLRTLLRATAAEALRRPPGVRRGRRGPLLHRTCCPGREASAAGYVERSGSARGRPGRASGRPNSIDWAVAALAVSYAGGVLVPVNSPLHGPRGRRGRRAHRTRPWSWSHDGFLGRDPDRGPGRRGRHSDRVVRLDDLTHPPGTILDGRRRCAAGRARRRGRHPVHLRHHRPLQGRDERAPPDHRRGPGLGRAGRGRGRTTATSWSTRSSTPSATRSASSSGCSPAATLYPVATFDVDETMRLIESERITVLPRRADALPVAAQRARPGGPRPVVAAARRDRRGRRTGGADRTDAGRRWRSTRWSRRSA